MATQSYFAGDPAPRPRLPIWHIVRCPPPGSYVTATILSENVYPVVTHYKPPTRILCGLDYCDPQDHKLPRRWYGYFQAIVPTLKNVALLEVPETAFIQIKEFTLDNSGSFRGLMIRMARRGKTKQSPISVDLVDVLRGVKSMPDEIDMWPMILKLFKVN